MSLGSSPCPPPTHFCTTTPPTHTWRGSTPGMAPLWAGPGGFNPLNPAPPPSIKTQSAAPCSTQTVTGRVARIGPLVKSAMMPKGVIIICNEASCRPCGVFQPRRVGMMPKCSIHWMSYAPEPHPCIMSRKEQKAICCLYSAE